MIGSLQIAVMMDPFDEDSWDTTKGDHYTDLEIEGREWEELFFNVLQAPEGQKYIDGEDIQKYYEHQENLFKENLTDKGYPMLGRIWWMFRDTNYLPSEVHQLLAECLKLQKKTENVYALSTLGKLIAACYEALKINSGLCFLSD